MNRVSRQKILEQVLEAASDLAMTYFQKREGNLIEMKEPGDYVSRADRDVEELIRQELETAFPDDALVCEESGGVAEAGFWAVDPIDGSANFLSGNPLWAVSIAYVEDGSPRLGGIALPALGEVHIADAGRTLNLERSLAPAVVFGVGRNAKWNRDDRIAWENQAEGLDLNVCCLGSCAASLAFCASRRMAGYVEKSVYVWDIAAGAVLCAAAGLDVECEIDTRTMRGDIFVMEKSARMRGQISFN
ncbi:inositol monophosphatase family protein [Roseibium album]|uniref:inositol monophosphatase family protein n=1 Tax=Roseibium album TaxID=311410 RepID=UPI002492A1F5|nr:inositol monophosphatase family protein [Roseibium album]